MPVNGIRQGFQQRGGFANPIGQCGTIEVNAFASKNLALPVERQMIRILRDQHMSEQVRSRPAAFNGTRGQRRLMDRLAAGTGQLEPHNTVHPKLAGDVFQFFGHILAEPLEFAAAATAGFARGDHLLIARKVIRQWLALRPRRILLPGYLLDLGGRRDLLAFQQQLQLVERFGAGAKAMSAHPEQLVSQLFDQQVAGMNLGIPSHDLRLARHQHRLQFGGVIGQIIAGVQHAHLIAKRPQKRNPENVL